MKQNQKLSSTKNYLSLKTFRIVKSKNKDTRKEIFFDDLEVGKRYRFIFAFNSVYGLDVYPNDEQNIKIDSENKTIGLLILELISSGYIRLQDPYLPDAKFFSPEILHIFEL